MRWWQALGAVAALAAVGAAAGYAVGDATPDRPVPIRSIAPVPAQSPAAPTQSETACFTDPPDPPLGVDLSGTEQRLRAGGRQGYAVTLDVPDGWHSSHDRLTRWSFTDTVAFNTYVMRVDILAVQPVSVPAAKDSRLAQLRQAAKDGNLPDLRVESQSDDAFVATYRDKGYCRVTAEQFLTLGTSSAYVELAVTGREEDRAGLIDLLARTAASMRVTDPR